VTPAAHQWPPDSAVTRVDPSGRAELRPEIVRVRCQDWATSKLCCQVKKPASVGGRWTAAARCTCGDSDDPCRVDFYSGLGCTGKVLATAEGMFCLQEQRPKFYCIGCETAEDCKRLPPARCFWCECEKRIKPRGGGRVLWVPEGLRPGECYLWFAQGVQCLRSRGRWRATVAGGLR
jgi:hypothetical protein